MRFIALFPGLLALLWDAARRASITVRGIAGGWMQEFAEACAAWLSERPEAVCGQAARELRAALLQSLAPATRVDVPEPRALAYLQPLLGSSDRSDLAEPLAALAPDLIWF